MEEPYVQRKNERMRKKYAKTRTWLEIAPSKLKGIGETRLMTTRSMIQTIKTLESRMGDVLKRNVVFSGLIPFVYSLSLSILVAMYLMA